MPDMPSVRAASQNFTIVSVMASSASRTSPGCSLMSAESRLPDSFLAIDIGEKIVGSTGSSPMRRSKPMRTIVSLRKGPARSRSG